MFVWNITVFLIFLFFLLMGTLFFSNITLFFFVSNIRLFLFFDIFQWFPMNFFQILHCFYFSIFSNFISFFQILHCFSLFQEWRTVKCLNTAFWLAVGSHSCWRHKSFVFRKEWVVFFIQLKLILLLLCPNIHTNSINYKWK